MKSIAILPLRAGSKGIPGKNKKRLLGRQLYTWVLTEAIFSNIDKIYVFTDDEKIISFIDKNYKWTEKVETVIRSKESATDTASTEMAMEELAEKLEYNFDIFCLLQATSPFTSRDAINRVIDKVKMDGFDSALTVVETKRFIWDINGNSLNYDFKSRPRRQDFDGLMVENGAVYASTKNNFIDNKNRLGGKIGIVQMDEDSLTEIDEPADFTVVEELLKRRLVTAKRGFRKIKALCLDVDGVFTDSTLTVSKDGEHTKTFSVRDGMGLHILRESGIEVLVITSENSPIVEQRMKKLEIDDVFLGISDKYSFLEKLLESKSYLRDEIAYIGDDINDQANILSCGLGLCPVDAEPEIKSVADIVLNNKGGEKLIREACGFIIKYNQRF